MTEPSLVDLPLDIFLDILEHLPVEDAIPLSMTCSQFYKYFSKPSYWLKSLKKMGHSMLLACPAFEDLSTHDSHTLQRIALRTLRRERNWNSEQPQIIGTPTSLQLNENRLDIIFQMPGTDLFALHSPQYGTLTCWNIHTGQHYDPIQVGRKILDVSPGDDSVPGKFSMGLLIADPSSSVTTANILVVCMDSKADPPNLSITFRQNLPSTFHYWAIFMTPEIVGVLRVDGSVDVIAFNRQTGTMTVVRTNIDTSTMMTMSHSGTSSYNDNVYILMEQGLKSYLFCCPSTLLPYQRNDSLQSESFLACSTEPFHTWPDVEDLPGGRGWLEERGALSANPLRGVPAVTLHTLFDHLGGVHGIHIHFWTKPNPSSDSRPPMLTPAHSLDIPGQFQDSSRGSWDLVLLPHSGLHVLLIANLDNVSFLKLIRFDPVTSTSIVRTLPIPDTVSLNSVMSLSIDDHLGTVALLDSSGVLHTIPYA